jgi:hypothetical protein
VVEIARNEDIRSISGWERGHDFLTTYRFRPTEEQGRAGNICWKSRRFNFLCVLFILLLMRVEVIFDFRYLWQTVN